MTQALTFNDITLTPIPHQNSLWIRSVELARALGLSREDKVAQIYQRHADEFTSDMTQLIENVAEPQNEVFQNLSAGRVTVAGPLAFDDASHPSKRTDPERKALTAIINTWVGMAPIHYASARAQVNAHFGVASVDSLTIAQIREAIRYVQNKIDALPAPSSPALLSRSSVYADRVKALHELENRFMQFEGETRSRFSEIEREYRRINQGAFADMLSLITSIDQGARDRLTEALVCHSYESYRWIDEGLARMRVAIITARAANRTLAR